MARLNAANNVSTEITADITASDTEIPVKSTSNMPAYPFRLSIAEEEVVEVTDVASNTLTVKRAVEDVSAGSYDKGTKIQSLMTAGMYDELETEKGAQDKADKAESNANSYTDKNVFSGKYADLPDKPTIPSKASDVNAASQADFDAHAGKTVANSEIHGLRVNDNGELEFNDGDEWKHAVYGKIIPDDLTKSPGAKRLISGDMNAGFFSEVPSSELFTGSELASEVGITEGTPHNDDVPWIKYSYKGKICFRPKKSIRYGISYDEIERNGCVDGTTTVQKNGMKFKVRLMSGATQDPASNSGDRDAPGSEWNQIMLPISEKAIDDSWEYPDYVGSDVPVWKHGFGSGKKGMYTDDDLGFVSGDGYRHWCQEHSQNGSSNRVNHGTIRGPSDSSDDSSDYTYSYLGWAPTLELIE